MLNLLLGQQLGRWLVMLGRRPKACLLALCRAQLGPLLAAAAAAGLPACQPAACPASCQ